MWCSNSQSPNYRLDVTQVSGCSQHEANKPAPIAMRMKIKALRKLNEALKR